MDTHELQLDCQIKDVHYIANGPQESIPFRRSVRLYARKVVGPRNARLIKKYTYNFLTRLTSLMSKNTKPQKEVAHIPDMSLKVGDLVRVRSREDIDITLNHWGQLKGCSFLPEMAQYCGTNQRVLKVVERFIDERDLQVRKTKGIVLLEGIICQGTAGLGRCDRNCYYFWREEWLEKI